MPVPGYVNLLEFNRKDEIRFCKGVDPSKVEIPELKKKSGPKKVNCKPNIWKHVPFYPHIQCCSKGYVRVVYKDGTHKVPFHSRYNKKSFTRVTIDNKDFLVHRLMASAWLGAKGKDYVRFKDGNRCNIRPSNLELCTKSECDENEHHVLSMGSADIIRKEYDAGKKVSDLSRDWDVSRSMIYKIIRYESYIPHHLRV